MFTNITCLLLDKRHDEQERIIREFGQHGLTVDFFLVGDGVTFPANKYGHIDVEPPRGRFGYKAWVERPNSYNAFLSFKKIITKAVDQGLKDILICEDDVTLQDNFGEILPLALEQLKTVPPWDMFYLCANHTWTPTRIVSPNILQLKGSGGWQCVWLNRSIFKEILKLPLIAPIDEMCGKTLHHKYNCYAAWPNVAIPKSGYSYCEGVAYDNTELYKNRGC